MLRNDRILPREYRRPKVPDGRFPARISWRLSPLEEDSGPAIAAIAQSEGWLEPPRLIERVTLRPWQRAVFWGLRVYIAIMLVVMGWGIIHVAGG